jgi:hypothetical protein
MNMCNFKKVLAMVLAVVMMLSVAALAFAEPQKFVYSPTKGDTTTYTFDYAYGGVTTEAHKDGTTIAFKDTDGSSTLEKPMVTDVAAKKAGTLISLAGVPYVSYDEKGKKIIKTYEVQQIGTGSYGIGENDETGNVTGLNLKSKAPLVTVASRALQDTKIANFVIDAENVQINKNATKGTKAKTIAFAFPQMTKSKQLVIKKGAFNGAKKVRIVVSSKMTSKELKKLKKRLKKQLGATAYKKVKIVRSAA